ncbi:hypothetical protein ACFL47_02530 [Candidatus Latescibacterota bacterium]
MDNALIQREFEKLTRRLGIDVRYTTGGPSGLCIIKGKQVMFVDRNLGSDARIKIFTDAFRSLDLSGYFVVPVIRRLLGEDANDFGDD